MDFSELRKLEPGDEPLTFEFLDRHRETSLFLISNIERAGLEDRGEPLQATYVAHFHEGAISALAAHAWNGNLLLQGDQGIEAAALSAVARTGRPPRGLVGPPPLIRRVRGALGLEGAATAHDEMERLFAVDLGDIRVPALLDEAEAELRAPTEAEAAGILTDWRVEYQIETLGSERSAGLEAGSRALMEAMRVEDSSRVLLHRGRLVAFTAFNARTRGIVQVGGVFTPRELRGRGYARSAVAGSLMEARLAGARRSVLFTGPENHAAIRAYTAIGYEPIGEFGLVLFR
jgi:RimJ/RimL family protein N-acetyltransferase